MLAVVAVPILWFPVRGQLLRAWAEPALGLDEPAKVGVRYQHELHTHCGIEWTELGGQAWRTNEPVGDPVSIWWPNPSHKGSIRLTSADRAEFVGTNGLTVRFVRGGAVTDVPGCK